MPGGAGALGRAEQRAEVAGIGDAVDRDEERRRAAPRGAARSSSGVSVERGGLGQHPLRRLAARLGEELGRPTDRTGTRSASASSTMSASDVGRVLLGEQPDLPHPPPAGEQQLAHGLAPLHLVAAEPLALAGRRVAAAPPPPCLPRGVPGPAGPGLRRARGRASASGASGALGRPARFFVPFRGGLAIRPRP